MSLGIAEEVARVYSKSGFKPAKLREIEMRRLLAKRRYVDPADMAYACADLRDKEQTFIWLDKALADKAGGLEVVKIVPSLDPWRSDPRYLDLIKRMARNLRLCPPRLLFAIRTCDQNLPPVLDAPKCRLYEYTNRFTGTV
jgi:hypothetical protein